MKHHFLICASIALGSVTAASQSIIHTPSTGTAGSCAIHIRNTDVSDYGLLSPKPSNQSIRRSRDANADSIVLQKRSNSPSPNRESPSRPSASRSGTTSAEWSPGRDTSRRARATQAKPKTIVQAPLVGFTSKSPTHQRSGTTSPEWSPSRDVGGKARLGNASAKNAVQAPVTGFISKSPSPQSSRAVSAEWSPGSLDSGSLRNSGVVPGARLGRERSEATQAKNKATKTSPVSHSRRTELRRQYAKDYRANEKEKAIKPRVRTEEQKARYKLTRAAKVVREKAARDDKSGNSAVELKKDINGKGESPNELKPTADEDESMGVGGPKLADLKQSTTMETPSTQTYGHQKESKHLSGPLKVTSSHAEGQGRGDSARRMQEDRSQPHAHTLARQGSGSPREASYGQSKQDLPLAQLSPLEQWGRTLPRTKRPIRQSTRMEQKFGQEPVSEKSHVFGPAGSTEYSKPQPSGSRPLLSGGKTASGQAVPPGSPGRSHVSSESRPTKSTGSSDADYLIDNPRKHIFGNY